MQSSLILATSTSVFLAACAFDRSGIDTAADAGAPGDLDGGSAPGPCPADIHAAVQIGGKSEPPAQGQPYVHALVGDVIELSAAGSCARSGTLSYRWQISPIDGTRETAAPGLGAETITLFPTQPEKYTVTLTVSAGGLTDERTVFGIQAQAWELLPGLPGSQEISDLATSSDTLWLATPMGAFARPLAGAGSVASLANTTGDNALSGRMAAVYYDPTADAAWFGHRDARGEVWRVRGDQAPPVLAVSIDSAAALGERAKVQDIAPAAVEMATGRPVGVAVATDKGITRAPDGQAFQGDLEPLGIANIHALATGPGSRWAGGTQLVDITNSAAPMAYDLPDSGDDKIRALTVDAATTELWAGSADRGAIRLRPQGAANVLTLYGPSQGLDSSDIRALAVETSGAYAGDVWAATASGVARYVRQRDTWLTMGNAHGLSGYTDVRAIAIDQAMGQAAGRRAIYAGTKNGLVRTAIPAP